MSEFERDVDLVYGDAGSGVTRRRVTVDTIEGQISPDGHVLVERVHGFCHLRRARRSFLMERIVGLSCAETGEIIDDLWSWLENEEGATARNVEPGRTGTDVSRPRPLLGTATRLLIVAAGVFLVVWALRPASSPTGSVAGSSAVSPSLPEEAGRASQAPPTLAEVGKPAREVALVRTIDDFSARYRDAPNEMAQGALRYARAREICSDLKNRTLAKLWAGTVETLSSNNDGRGVLAIRLSSHLVVSTWNNAVSDFVDGTLIDPTSSLGVESASLKQGELVRFGGDFVSGGEDCMTEQSITQGGSMSDPTFTFRFREVTPLDH